MNFRSIADLQRDVLENLHRLPTDIDVVVGVPRSGMLAGSIVALLLNLPLADLEGFAAGRVFASGKTRRRAEHDGAAAGWRHALVVDDSTRSGQAMDEARAKLAEAGIEARLTFCAVYGVGTAIPSVDLTLKDVPVPRIFEWNVLHHPVLADACVDIDGVLCHDPDAEENDDGEAYLNFLSHARPLHRPTARIGQLVTSRLERYRPQTEAWLKRQGIDYGELVMLDLPDAETRRRNAAHGSFKGGHYKRSKAALFIESERRQAQQIADISGKPVLSIEGPVMCLPGGAMPEQFIHAPTRPGVNRLVHDMLGDRVYRTLRRVAGR